MKNTIMRDLLINENNIKIMQDEKKPYFNVKKLLNNDNLTQSQCVKFGDLFQKYVKIGRAHV